MRHQYKSRIDYIDGTFSEVVSTNKRDAEKAYKDMFPAPKPIFEIRRFVDDERVYYECKAPFNRNCR